MLTCLENIFSVPRLQTASAALVESLIESKAKSWALLLRRTYTRYSTFCEKQNIPIFPITATKAALYLTPQQQDSNAEESEDDFEDRVGPEVGAKRRRTEEAQDGEDGITVQRNADDFVIAPLALRMDPQLVGATESLDAKSLLKRKSDFVKGRPRKQLKKKTLEQYINRLTTLRTPTTHMWKPRTGKEGQNDSGLGIHSIIRELLEQAGGEGSLDVKKRTRMKKGMGQKSQTLDGVRTGSPRLSESETEETGEKGLDLIVGSNGNSSHVAGPPTKKSRLGGILDPSLSHVPPIQSNFAIRINCGPASFSIAPSTSPTDLTTSAQLLDGSNPYGGLNESYSLSPQYFALALQYVRGLVLEGLTEQTLGDIARSVQAAAGAEIPNTNLVSEGDLINGDDGSHQDEDIDMSVRQSRGGSE